MRKIVILIAAVAILFGAWFYLSPLYTLREMKSAAEARDADKLSAYVDYPAVRADLKGDLRRMIGGHMAQPQGQGLEALGSAVALALLDPMIDAMVTPEGVESMFAQQPKPPQGSPAPAPRVHKPPVQAPTENPVIERRGLNEFRVRHKDPSKGAIVFRRHGLGWKMAGFDLPDTTAS